MNYVIVSGYHAPKGIAPGHAQQRAALQWLNKIWCLNLMRYAHPSKTFIISTGGDCTSLHGNVIKIDGDLGCCGHILHGHKPYFMQQAAAIWMTGAMLAYMSECDMIYLEQDALAFGPWATRLYDELGTKSAIFGRAKLHSVATSMFLVRHCFLPDFVRCYLDAGRENVPSRIAELKILRLIEQWPEYFAYHTMGYDTDRPLNMADPAWYAQQMTREEIVAAQEAGLLINCKPPALDGKFSNQHEV